MAKTAEQKLEIINTIIDLFKFSRSYFQDYYELCGVLKDLYNVELPDAIKDGLDASHPGLMPPDMHLAVNDLVAGIDGMLFTTSPYVEAEAERDTPRDAARRATTWLEWATRMSDLEMEFLKTVSSGCKFAAGAGYVDIEEVDDVELRKDVLLSGGDRESETRYTDFVNSGRKLVYPVYKPRPLLRIFPDPSPHRRNWIVDQSQVTLLDLMQEKAKGESSRYKFKVDEITKSKTSYPTGDANLFFPKKIDYSSHLMKEENFPVELLHFRGWLPIKQSTGEPKFLDVIATVANRQVLIQFDINEWHYPAVDSFIFTYLLPTDEEQVYPVGKVEAGMDLLLQQFYARNQRLMNLEYLLNGTYWTDDDKMPDYVTAETGKIHKVTKGSKFERMDLGDITNKAYVEVDVLKDELRYIFHSNQYSAGQDPRRKETAYGIEKLTQGSQKGVKFEKKIIIKTGLEKILNRYLEIGQMYAQNIPLKMFDSDEVQMIGAENLFGRFNLKLKTIEPWTRPIQRQELLTAVKIYNGDPQVDQIELKRRHFEAMEFPDPEKLVPDPASKLADIERENKLMIQQGVFIEPLPHEDHVLHFKNHQPYQQNPIVGQHMELTARMYQEQQTQGPPVLGAGPRLPQTEPNQLMQVSQRLEPGRGPPLSQGGG